MTSHRRVREQRNRHRRRRGLIFGSGAAVAAAAVIAATFAYDGGLEGAQAVPLAGPTPGAVSGPAAAPARDKEPAPLTAAPADQPARGMVYDGLRVAPKGDRCAGVYRTDAGLCTHGPDAPPAGVDIHKDTPPAVPARARAVDPARPGNAPSASGRSQDAPAAEAKADARSATPKAPGAPKAQAAGGPAAGPAGQTVACDGDGTSGNRVQVVYAHGPGRDRYASYLDSFRKWAADADLIYSASAKETGGVRHIRYVTAADCTPSVLDVELSDSALAEFSATNSALAAKGLGRRDRKYMIFADTQVYCGIGTFNGDERPGQDNLSNFGPSYGRSDTGCWGGHTAAHELGHNLGAVNNSAPNSSKGAHCTDEWDVMCYSDTPYYPQMRNICTNQASENILDCNHDDYFNTAPRAGSYLATHWNVADNQFLMRGKGDGDGTGPTPTPTPTTRPGAGPDVTVGQIRSDSVVASWPAVSGALWYQVLLDGRHLTWTQATVLRIYNLAPGTAHKVAVSVRDRDGKDSGPGRAAAFRTAPAGGGGTTPKVRYLLGSGSTGTAAEIWGGRTADNTVLVGAQATGYAQQQWYFDDAGSGTVRIRSAVSGKCLQPGGAPRATMWVAQQPCGTAAAQRWLVRSRAGGVTVTDRSGSYALSVSDRPYYGAWLLELQPADGRAVQNWTLQKAG